MLSDNIDKAIQDAKGILMYQQLDLNTRFEVFEQRLTGLVHDLKRGTKPVKGRHNTPTH